MGLRSEIKQSREKMYIMVISHSEFKRSEEMSVAKCHVGIVRIQSHELHSISVEQNFI